MLNCSLTSILMKSTLLKNASCLLIPKYLTHRSTIKRNTTNQENEQPQQKLYHHNNNNHKKNEPIYSQGQYEPVLEVQEYFYYLDQDGQLYLDDTKVKTFASCYKEQKFLEFFFENLRQNNRERYIKEFPWVSLCGSERNYLRCEDLPFVITNLDEKYDVIQLNQMRSVHWSFHFDPERLYYNLKNERLYYLFEDKQVIDNKRIHDCHDDPARLKHLDKLPCRLALVKPQISIRLMRKTKILLDKEHQMNKNEPQYKFEYKSKSFDLDTSSNVNSKAKEIYEKYSLYGKNKKL